MLNSVPSQSQKPIDERKSYTGLSSLARILLFIVFSFTIIATPISSVSYAIEAALLALGGDLTLLIPTMALVVIIIAIVTLNYHQLVARFPDGGGSAAAVGAAFGEAWAFLPIGALLVDFVLTIAISVAAGSSAIVAYFPSLAPERVLVALVLLLLVAFLTWFGHGGRIVFAILTLIFILVSAKLLTKGMSVSSSRLTLYSSNGLGGGWFSDIAVALAFPVAMALATGIEAPSSAIAQLGHLNTQGRKRFGQATLWLTLLIAGSLTLGLAALAVHLGVGLPPPDSTQTAELARVAGSPRLFAAFQLTTTLVLLAAAGSSFQAGSDLLKTLARRASTTGEEQGILPQWMGKINRFHTPYWGLVLYLAIAALVVIAANAQDQVLVLFFAVAIFVSFLMGLLAMVRFSYREHSPLSLALNLLGTIVVSLTLILNLLRGWPLISLAAAGIIAATLYTVWVQAGKPRSVALAKQNAEQGADSEQHEEV